MFHALGALAIWAGFLLLIVGGVFFLIAAFRESVLWGLGLLVFPVLNLVFLVLHWSRAKNAFFLQLYGLGFVLAGALVFHARLPWH